MTFSLFLDLVVIALLVATILYSLRLNKQLTTLYESRGELQSFIESFTLSLNKAEISMAALKATGESTFTAVQEALGKAQALKDDLSYLVERGEDIAMGLDESIRTARHLQKDLEALKQQEIHATSLKPEPDNEATDLIQQLRNIR